MEGGDDNLVVESFLPQDYSQFTRMSVPTKVYKSWLIEA